MKKIYKMVLVLMVAMLAVFGPNVLPAQTATTITAEAASTSVKQLTVGKSYTISGYTKVKSSKTSIATSTKKSSKKYTVKAKKKGTTTLKCYNASGKLVKTVYLIATNSSSFKYDTSAITLTKGKTKTVKATVQSGCTVKYSSSKTSVATVNSKGKITAKKAGSATISAKVYYKGKLIKTMKKNVTVKNASTASASSSGSSSSGSTATGTTSGSSSSSGSSGSSSGSTTTVPTLSYTFDTSAATISPGKTASIKATVTSGYTVAYSSSDTSVATVTSSGVVTGVFGGTATITVKISYGGTVYKTLTKKVTVRTYQLSSTSLTVDKASTATLKCATSAGEYSSSDKFTWTSSDKTVATVSGSGYSCTITGKAAGTATITCAVNSVVTLTCKVTVNNVFINRVSDNTHGSIDAGRRNFIAIYHANASDEINYKFSNDCLEMNEFIGSVSIYDDVNEMNGYETYIYFYGRKQGTCEVGIYINGTLFTTVSIYVTGTDTDYYEYVAWRKEVEDIVWTGAEELLGRELTDLEKIVYIQGNVNSKYGYSSSRSSAYCFSDGEGGDCWAYTMLACDVASDLGYSGEGKRMSTADSLMHRDAYINMNGTYYYITQTGAVYDSNEKLVSDIIYVPSGGFSIYKNSFTN